MAGPSVLAAPSHSWRVPLCCRGGHHAGRRAWRLCCSMAIMCYSRGDHRAEASMAAPSVSGPPYASNGARLDTVRPARLKDGPPYASDGWSLPQKRKRSWMRRVIRPPHGSPPPVRLGRVRRGRRPVGGPCALAAAWCITSASRAVSSPGGGERQSNRRSRSDRLLAVEAEAVQDTGGPLCFGLLLGPGQGVHVLPRFLLLRLHNVVLLLAQLLALRVRARASVNFLCVRACVNMSVCLYAAA